MPTHRFRGPSLRPSFCAALLAVACGGSTSAGTAPDASSPGTPDTGGGGADGSAPVPRAAVASELGATKSPGGTMMCPLGIGTTWLTIGTDTMDPITSGTSYAGNPLVVSCTVHPVGAGFDVTLQAVLAGQASISVINATIGSDTTLVSKGVSAAFQKTSTNTTFTESDCTWDFGGQATDIDPAKTAGNPLGIAAGRIWGNVSCPTMMNAANGEVCQGQAELRFENCTQ